MFNMESIGRRIAELRKKANMTQMELADKARDYDVAMQSIPSTIADLQTKFSQVVAPTENLVQNMRLLRFTSPPGIRPSCPYRSRSSPAWTPSQRARAWTGPARPRPAW